MDRVPANGLGRDVALGALTMALLRLAASWAWAGKPRMRCVRGLVYRRREHLRAAPNRLTKACTIHPAGALPKPSMGRATPLHLEEALLVTRTGSHLGGLP